jgi:beta-1,2-mannobiose phosphorylase / 1,2-beta-oligomannan phosphorylase
LIFNGEQDDGKEAAMLNRKRTACLLRSSDIAPSRPDFEVVGAFNPGAVSLAEQGIALMVRVAERPLEKRMGFTPLPRWNVQSGEIKVDWVSNDEIEPLDPRVVKIRKTGLVRLTFISHLQIFRSAEPFGPLRSDKNVFVPERYYEEFGVEDPRITYIDGRYWFTYVAVSCHGPATALGSTMDFQHFERHGVIFPPENKDVVLFPEKVAGEYICLHRPNVATPFAIPEIWMARSNDMIHWGRNDYFHGGAGEWEAGRIGAGAPPFRTDRGWVEIYHGNQKALGGAVGAYSGGALLMDHDRPERVKGRTHEAIMIPQEHFEREGFVPNVVFPTGAIIEGDSLFVYYGAADTCCGVTEFSVRELERELVEVGEFASVRG